jgi:uncharacterized membrane protein
LFLQQLFRNFLILTPPRHYNLIAGQSIERLAALSDGVFAVAMTLLVLDLHTPAAQAVHGDADLLRALGLLAPRLLLYMMSFLTLGIFWVGQQTQLNHFERIDRDLAWVHLAFLFVVTLMPFSTALMGAFMAYRVALVAYWLNILLLGSVLLLSWRLARRRGLVAADLADSSAVIEKRIIVAQALYALGAALCVFSTGWSLGFIVLLQLNYAVGLGPLRRLIP